MKKSKVKISPLFQKTLKNIERNKEFEKGEINLYTAFTYVKFIIRGRWPRAEKTIFNSGEIYDIIRYMEMAEMHRNKYVEKIISLDARQSLVYAQILNSRFKEGESTIMNNYSYLYSYIKLILNFNHE